MLKSYRVGGSQCLCGGASVYVVAHKILVSAPVPLGFFGTLNWAGLVLGWVWGIKNLGLGLDNKSPLTEGRAACYRFVSSDCLSSVFRHDETEIFV